MYLAPLNIDLFFKKVFSDPKLAKSFLQDILGIKITEIKVLGIEYKLSDDSVIVKFDYRCKIDGQYVIIEMQQRYKKDVVKRFYLYHCVSTALQLETLKPVVITKLNGDTYKEKDYGGVEPVWTIVWMVDDTLGFDEDFVVFTTLPETTKDFIADETLWSQPLETIKTARAKTLKILNNKTKGLDFLQQNKIIKLFQDNIVKNRSNKPYTKWFVVGKRSKNPNNVESDFEEFKQDKIMSEVIRRLERTKLDAYESKYVSDLFYYEGMVVESQNDLQRAQENAMRAQQDVTRAQQNAANAQQEAVLQKERADKEKQEAVLQKERADKEKQEKQEMLLKAVHGFLLLGKDIPYIADILGISIEEARNLAQQIERK